MFSRKLAIRMVLPITWLPSKKRTATQLQRFSVTEADSAWQILYTLDHLDDPQLRCKVLQHALEEVHHANEFDRVSREYCPELPEKPICERQPLFLVEKGKQGLIDFVAYAHVGEKDVFDQFDSYAAAIGECEAQSVFREAKLDEEGHVGLCMGILKTLVDGDEAARSVVRKTRWRRLYETWLRGGHAMGDTMLGVLLSAVYLTFGVLMTWSCRSRLRDSGRPSTLKLPEHSS